MRREVWHDRRRHRHARRHSGARHARRSPRRAQEARGALMCIVSMVMDHYKDVIGQIIAACQVGAAAFLWSRWGDVRILSSACWALPLADLRAMLLEHEAAAHRLPDGPARDR